MLAWRGPMPTARDLRDLGALVAVAALLAGGHLALRIHVLGEPGLAWIPDAPVEAAACELAEGGDDAAVVAAADRIRAAEAIAAHGQPGVTFVDARAAAACAAGRVPGALCLPADEAAAILSRESVALGPDDLVIAYCEGLTCERSEALARLLRELLGCRKVQVLEGGWPAWLAAAGPTEPEAAAPAAGGSPEPAEPCDEEVGGA